MTHPGGRPRRPRPSLDEIEIYDLLHDPVKLVELLDRCGGSLDIFVRTTGGAKDVMLARALVTLSLPGNEEHKIRWELLLNAYTLAKMSIYRDTALLHLKKMPKPTDKTGLSEWLRYASFWTSEFQEFTKTKSRLAAKVPDVVPDKNVKELSEMLSALKTPVVDAVAEGTNGGGRKKE